MAAEIGSPTPRLFTPSVITTIARVPLLRRTLKAVLAQAGKHSPWIDWESVRKEDPEVLVLLPCGFDLARTRSEAASLTGLPGWNTLRAVRNGRVFVVDGNALFNRPGPRLVDSLECLAEMLHPTLFPARHRGLGWQPL